MTDASRPAEPDDRRDASSSADPAPADPAPGAVGPDGSAPAAEPRRWTAFWICAAVAILTILDLAKVNVTLGPIEHTLGASTAEVQLIVAGYVLAFGLALVPAGRLGDLRSRKALFLIGLTGFALASTVCALSASTTMLVIGRVLQGAAAGTLMPQVIGLIQQLFQGRERGKAFGIFGASIGIGTAFGPTIGGLLIGAFGEEGGWRATFGMNIPLALLLLAAAWRLLPARQAHGAAHSLDLGGVTLLAGAVCSLMLPFVLSSGQGANPAIWWLLALSAAFAAAFVLWEQRELREGRVPLIDFALFATPSYRYGVLVTTLLFMAMPAGFLVMTMLLQLGLGREPVVVGLVTVPYAIASAIVAAVTGPYTHRHAPSFVALGMGLMVAGFLGVLLATPVVAPETGPWVFAGSLVVAGIGAGFVMGANQMRMLSRVPVTEAGVAGSFAQVGQRVGNAIGVSIGSTAFFAALAAGGGEGEAAYRGGATAGLGFVVAVLGLGLVVALLDLVASRREPQGPVHG